MSNIEAGRNLTEMLEGISHNSEKSFDYKERGDQIIENLRNERAAYYLQVLELLRQASIGNMISQEQYDQDLKKLQASSWKEFECSLELLELDQKLELSKQYASQTKILEDAGVLEELPVSKKLGIIGIDGKEYPLPSLGEVIKEISQSKGELLLTKESQGFNKLLLVPFGVSLSGYASLYDQLLKECKFSNQPIRSYGGDRHIIRYDYTDEGSHISLDHYLKNGDIDGKIVYYPKTFDRDYHGGKTKKELIKQSGGWQLLMIEEMPIIPTNGRKNVKGGRRQFNANTSPEKYLAIMSGDPEYVGEEGFTPEAWISYAITKIAEDRSQIDEVFTGGVCENLGTFLPGLNQISVCHYNMKVFIMTARSDVSQDNFCTRTAVRLNKTVDKP